VSGIASPPLRDACPDRGCGRAPQCAAGSSLAYPV